MKTIQKIRRDHLDLLDTQGPKEISKPTRIFAPAAKIPIDIKNESRIF